MPVQSIEFKQCLMGSRFRNPALVHDNNTVGIPYCRESVSHNQSSPIRKCIVDCLLHHFFGFVVECTGGFVENQELGIFHHRTSNSQTLTLSSGKLNASIPFSNNIKRRKTMSLLWFLLIGIAAGWLAGQIMKGGGFGLLGDLIVGVIGALLGGYLFGLLGISAGGTVGSLITATVGAIVLIALLRLIRH